jgi:tryptophanyl-tRNA synthetase
MSIESDSTPLEAPKNTETCNIFAIYKLLATDSQIQKMRENYANANADYGYGHAKQELFELIIDKFKTEREKYNYYMSNLQEIDQELFRGAEKASAIANGVLKRVRQKLGFSF